MKLKFKCLFASLLLMMSMVFLNTLSAQTSIDSLSTLVKTLLSPPKLQGLTMGDAFTQASTYFAAILTFAFIYLSQWVPPIKKLASKIPSGYLRAIVLGGSMLWVLVANGGLYDTQAIIAFVFSNIIWEVVKGFLPTSPPVQTTELPNKEGANIPTGE